jgi:hypothetical protein
MKKLILSAVLLASVALVSAKDLPAEKLTLTYETTNVTAVNAFCKLIQIGDYDAVKSLIEDGVDVNKKSTGLTPLMFAARHNKANIAQLLIDNGAKLKTKNTKGFNALKLAEISNAKDSYEVIKTAMMNQGKNKKRK